MFCADFKETKIINNNRGFCPNIQTKPDKERICEI